MISVVIDSILVLSHDKAVSSCGSVSECSYSFSNQSEDVTPSAYWDLEFIIKHENI